MSGPKPKIVPVAVSGFVVPPPIDRRAAEEAYGAAIADAAWAGIVRAFREFGYARDALAEAPRMNENRNDPQSYPVARRRAGQKLGEALEFVRELASDRMMAQTLCVAAMGRTGAARDPYELIEQLLVAEQALYLAYMIVNASDPRLPATSASADDPPKWLARQVVRVLKDAGHDATLSGWALADREEVADCDLTPVERLLSALDVPPGDRPDGVARWLRDALRE